MTHMAPVPNSSRAPEQKVTASAAGAGFGGATAALIVWALSRYVFDGDVPAEVAVWVALAVPAILAFVVGYAAPHTPRTAVPPMQQES